MSRVAERAGALAGIFAERTGRRPDGVWAAPGRVNLIGEHTDYNAGFVLPFAIDREVVAAVGCRSDSVLRCHSLQQGAAPELTVAELGPGAVAGWSAYPLGVLWALREAGCTLPGLDIVLDGDVPSGGGLSSSAALEGAVALAVAELTGTDLTRTELALAGQRAENDVVGAPVGVMDQMASLLGEAGSAVFLDCRSLATELVPLDVAAAGLALWVMDIRVTHAHADGEYGARRRSCERAARALGVPALRDVSTERLAGAESTLDAETFRRARHIVTENDRVLATVARLRAGDVAGIGPLLTTSHASMRDDFEISCPELDTAVEAALAAGAIGARMTGGGFGGCALGLVPTESVAAVTETVQSAFATAGFQPPNVFAVTPGPGAHRVQ
jgi:galactokinase